MSEEKLTFDQVKNIIETEIKKAFPYIKISVYTQEDKEEGDIPGIFFVCDAATFNTDSYRELIDKLNYEYVIKNHLSGFYFIYE